MLNRSPFVNGFHEPVPPRLIHHAGNYIRLGDTFIVPGIATITAAPHRRPQDARAFAQRIAADPAAYLDVLKAFGVGGIVDLRPTSHAQPAFIGRRAGAL